MQRLPEDDITYKVRSTIIKKTDDGIENDLVLYIWSFLERNATYHVHDVLEWNTSRSVEAVSRRINRALHDIQ